MFKKFSEIEYTAALLQLLPIGKIWEQEKQTPQGDVYAILRARAAEYKRFDTMLAKLFEESIPSKANLMIDEWEKEASLPMTKDQINVRRYRVIDALNQMHNVTQESMAQIASIFNYYVTIQRVKGFKLAQTGKIRSGERKYTTNYYYFFLFITKTPNAKPNIKYEQLVRSQILSCFSIKFIYEAI